jgi:hypothetical protein
VILDAMGHLVWQTIYRENCLVREPRVVAESRAAGNRNPTVFRYRYRHRCSGKRRSLLTTFHNFKSLQGSSLLSVLVQPPREMLPLGFTSHPTRYVVRDKALLSPLSGVALV